MASSRGFLSGAYTAARKAGLSDTAARVAAAQAAHESNFGKAAPGNNFFGIKAGTSWKGAKQKLNTWEVIGGVKTRVKDSFRKYAKPEQSFKDWAALVAKNWPGVLTAATFEQAVAALKAGLPGGYATDPNYAAKLGTMNSRITDALEFSLPDQMTAPKTLDQTYALEAVAKAYNDPFRALDTVPNRPALRPDNLAYGGPKGTFSVDRPGSLPAVPSGQVTRGPSLAAPSVNRSVAPANPGQLGGIRMSSPSTPAVDRSVAPSNPGQLGGLRMSAPSMPSNLNSAPAGQVTRGPALSAPAVDRSVSPANPGQLGGVTMSNPKGNFSIGPSTADLAAQYASYRTPTAYQNVRTAMQQPAAPPAIAAPPAPVLAPQLAPPTVVQPPAVRHPPNPTVGLPPAPSLTAGDIYGGQVGSALDNTGLNTVSRDASGTTSVTNKYGATTGMTPGGYQTAYGSLPGISGPTASKIGGAIKGAVPGVAGSALGGLLAGPMGAMLGAALAKAVTSPGGALSGQQSFDTDYFGKLNAAKAQSGGAFPGAPSGGYKGSASFSNRSEGGMRGISPGAADAIGRGVGGLY